MPAYEGTYRGQVVRWDDDDVPAHAASLKSFAGEVEDPRSSAQALPPCEIVVVQEEACLLAMAAGDDNRMKEA